MATPVIMPRQGQSVESCIIGEWHKKKETPSKKGTFFLHMKPIRRHSMKQQKSTEH